MVITRLFFQLKDERALQIEEERTKKYRAEKKAETATSSETREDNQNYPSEERNVPEEQDQQDQQDPSYLSEFGVMSDTSY